MPLSLRDLRAQVRTIPVDLELGTLTVSYRPTALDSKTDALDRELRHGDIGLTERRAKLLLCVLTGWDLVDGSKPPKPVPVTEATLGELGLMNLIAIETAVWGDAHPNARLSTGSASGSSPAEPPASAPTGTPSSAMPAISA